MQRLADVVAGRFCYGVMAASAATFGFWSLAGADWFPQALGEEPSQRGVGWGEGAGAKAPLRVGPSTWLPGQPPLLGASCCASHSALPGNHVQMWWRRRARRRRCC